MFKDIYYMLDTLWDVSTHKKRAKLYIDQYLDNEVENIINAKQTAMGDERRVISNAIANDIITLSNGTISQLSINVSIRHDNFFGFEFDYVLADTPRIRRSIFIATEGDKVDVFSGDPYYYDNRRYDFFPAEIFMVNAFMIHEKTPEFLSVSKKFKRLFERSKTLADRLIARFEKKRFESQVEIVDKFIVSKLQAYEQKLKPLKCGRIFF